MRTIAIANHKGGVGKTATAHTLAVLAAEAGQRVLLVDVDPQSSLTEALGVNAEGSSLAEVLEGDKLARSVLVSVNGLDLLPADIALSKTERNLVNRNYRESLLSKALAGLDYDLCIIDCPPSQSLLTVNALVAADQVLIPTLPQVSDLRGLRLFIDTLDDIKPGNPDLQLLGVLMTFFDNRLVLHREALAMLLEQGVNVLETKIGRSIRVAEAPGFRETIITYEPGNPQAENYRKLAKEIGVL